jgi:enoyl-CoA hydratase/carnithine racemase
VEAASELISNGRTNGLASAVTRRRTDPPVQNQPEAITMGNAVDERVQVRFEDGIAYVTLSRPDRHNGMDFAMLEAVIRAQKIVRRHRDVRAVIIHGAGPSFCAGLDFKGAFARPAQAGLMYTQLWWPFRNDFQRWSLGWRKLGVPVIACIHGNCFGAGIQLALGADIRYATPDAKIYIMEAKWGLVPDMGGAVTLPELVPIDVAKELTMTGRVISGSEAKALNLVTHLADDPLAAAKALVAEIATRSPDAVGAGKFLLQDTYNSSGWSAERAERVWQRRLLGLANFRISVKRNEGKDVPFRPLKF